MRETMPTIAPIVDPPHEYALMVWALLQARGGMIQRAELAQAFALRSNPSLLLKLAPEEIESQAQEWFDQVKGRQVSHGVLDHTLRALYARDGVGLRSDNAGPLIVEASENTPANNELDPWYRFEARLALTVLDALKEVLCERF